MPDAVLLDLRMPGMGGLGFLLSLRAHPDRQGIPVAVVTADTHLDDTAQQAVQALGAHLLFQTSQHAGSAGTRRTTDRSRHRKRHRFTDLARRILTRLRATPR